MRSLIYFLVLCLIVSCSDKVSGGGATSVGNGFIALELKDGACATVIIVPDTYNPLIDDVNMVIEKKVPKDGFLVIDSLDDEVDYSLMVTNDSTGVYIESVILNDTISPVLEPLTTLYIPVDSNSNAGLIGTNIVGSFNNSTSEIIFNQIPSGLYNSLVLSSSEIYDSVYVQNENETVLDTGYAGFEIQKISLPDSMKNDTFFAVEPSIQGLYMGTSSGLYRFNYNKFFKPYSDQIYSSYLPVTAISCSYKYNGTIDGEFTYLMRRTGPIVIMGDSAYEPAYIGNSLLSISTNSDGDGYGFISYVEHSTQYNATTNKWTVVQKENITASFVETSFLYLGYADGSAQIISGDTMDVVFDEPNTDTIVSILHCWTNGTYIASTNAIYHYSENSPAQKILDLPSSPGRLIKDEKERIWFRYGKTGLGCIDSLTPKTYPSFLSNQYNISDICHKSGEIYLACYEKGVVTISVESIE